MGWTCYSSPPPGPGPASGAKPLSPGSRTGNAGLVVASRAGTATHPDWYHNLAAHPGQVEIEIGDRKLKVTPSQLPGSQRDEAWQRITAAQPRYARYQAKTDRLLPVIRLVPADQAGRSPGGCAQALTLSPDSATWSSVALRSAAAVPSPC